MSNGFNNKIYIAGKWDARSSISGMINILEKMNYIITHKWVEAQIPTPETKKQLADLNINCINEADLLIVDMSDSNYISRGNWTKIGVGLGLKKEIWIISENPSTSIFFHATGIVHFKSWLEVISELENYGTV